MVMFTVTRKETTPFEGQKSQLEGSRKMDFGIKYNMKNDGPAPDAVADKIFANTKIIKEYLIAEDIPDVNVSVIGVSSSDGPEGPF
ncbi:putative Phosphoglucomutase, cytoplasmic 1 [Cocos nucifera]|uniref:Putative Phosphoglucomutase, cytoplasmic 1 n=1 Tax=Cocos nucifera TaxID=13894 RepID=A0A8K0I3G7_COCNU|nr:putative Phosphoglucomutase, cytoplasmic 1 [Cocos nucifera]